MYEDAVRDGIGSRDAGNMESRGHVMVTEYCRSEDKFAPSTVSTGAETSIRKDIRFSEVALIDRDDIVSREADRVSTFMVYVDADCEGGGTEFPRLTMPDVENGRWCEFLECGEEDDNDFLNNGKTGITFKPIKGNAVFWENMRPDGRGDENTWHAGLPVKSGIKVGLNIWSWGSARRR
ncbi:unnamed protein product [Sphagnum balticum]